jgi:anti-sigma B factor antagonist
MPVSAAGDIDVATAPELRTRIYAEITANPGELVVVDLSETTFIDSSGLGVLVGALKQARQGGGDLCITRPTGRVWTVLTITGLHKVLLLPDGSRATPVSAT